MISRKQYLSKEATHEEYYSQFWKEYPQIVEILDLWLGAKIRASTDPVFNDIPLKLWDRLPQPAEIGKMLSIANGGKPGYITTSLSDWTCVYKSTARYLRDKAQCPPTP